MDFSYSSQQQPPRPPPRRQQFQQLQATCDTSQVQSYYYPTYYQNYQNPPQMQEYSSYYNTQFVNGYDHHQQQQQHSQPESTDLVIQPPGVSSQSDLPPQPAEGGGGAAPGMDLQNGYYPVPGLNPAAAAAVAVLAQITQIAGTLGGFQETHWPVTGGHGLVSAPGSVTGPEPGYYGPRPTYLRGGRSRYRGGGRRGGGSFRGRVKGNIGNHGPKTGRSSHEMGCVQEMGGTGDVQQHGASSSHSEPFAGADKVESKGEVAEHLATNEEEAKGDIQPQKPVPPSGSAITNQKPTRGAQCELCKVDCNSLEILEQHKNGKRHKKNLQRSQLSGNASKPGAGNCKKKISGVDSNPEVAPKSEITKEGVENKDSLPENLPTKVVGDNNKMEIQQASDKAENPHSSGIAQSDCLVSQPGKQMRGLKRKVKGGHGGKRVKVVVKPKGLQKPKVPKIVIPFICDLCNVRCDTKEVFDHHLSGKKHISKRKRFEAHQAIYGPVRLQALYPPSSIAQNLLHQQHPQTFCSPQSSYPPLGTDMPPPSHNAIPIATSTVSGLVHNPSPQMSNVTPQFGYPSTLFDTEQQAAVTQPEPKQGA